MMPRDGPDHRCATRSPPDAFALDGPTRPLDPRTHAYRADLADIVLAGRRLAPHYVRAEPARCVARAATVHAGPGHDAPAVSQLLHGEGFALLDRAGGWAWGRCVADDQVGYLPDAALGPPMAATHRVVAPLALAFAAPDIKSRVAAAWPVGALLCGVEADGFLRTAEGHVHARHVRPVDAVEPDWVAVAERLVGLPYRWGGRGDGGLDCSGLVQVALALAGRPAPRDSDQQRDALGRPLDAGEPLRRGDLLFFPGHVGIMVDGERIVHANAWWMGVTVEPLADVVARASASHPDPVVARRRMEDDT